MFGAVNASKASVAHCRTAIERPPHYANSAITCRTNQNCSGSSRSESKGPVSGIVGIVNLDGAPADRRLLARMTEFLTFRGPDAQRVWIDGMAGFGHTLLNTTDEAEREHQPLTVDGKVWIV